MDLSAENLARYLMGELSEPEMAALEERYFSDPQVFDQVLRTESELIDRYVGGQLSRAVRGRFEQSYMAHPRRREHVEFAEALVAKLREIAGDGSVGTRPQRNQSRWQRLLLMLRGGRPVARFSVAMVSILILVGGLWFFVESRRARRAESARTALSPASQTHREPDLQKQPGLESGQQPLSETEPSEAVTAESERLQRDQRQARQNAIPRVRSAPRFVSLALAVSGVRSADASKPDRLVIPPGTEQVHLELKVSESDYKSYRALLETAGGRRIFSRGKLPARKSGRSFVLVVPARKFASGDYILTLKGESQNGEIEDVSKFIFHVEKPGPGY